MKSIFQSFTFVLLVLTLKAQINSKEINKSLVKVNTKLYASKYEVSNKIYSDFILALKQKKEYEKLQIAQIDTLRWIDKISYNEPYVKYYHSHPAYFNYPVVNVSYDGAQLFCEWLTETYNNNPKILKILKENQNKINWYALYCKPSIFTLDYKQIAINFEPLAEDIVAKALHPKRIDRLMRDYGFDFEDWFD